MDEETRREFEIVVSRNIANLWTWQAAVISHLARAMRDSGMEAAKIEAMLQAMDADADLLEGDDDQAFATGTVASVRARLRQP